MACLTDELIDNYTQLVEKVRQKFKPDTPLLMEVLPLKDKGKNKTSNQRIELFNDKLKNLQKSRNTITSKFYPQII